MADAKSPMQKQREQRRAQGWRDVNVWLTPEGQQRIARLMEPGESLSTLIDRALAALDTIHSRPIRSRTSETTSDHAEDLQARIAHEVSRYFTSDGFRDNLFLPLMKQALTRYLPSDLTRYLPSDAITIAALPVEGHSPHQQVSVISGDKRSIVQRLRDLQAQGLSLQKIADRLNSDGVPTLSGKGRWQKGTIGNLLAQGEERL
jgi:Recombinase